MSVVIGLDVYLVVLGLIAVSPRLWMRFRHRWIDCSPPQGRGMRTATVLLFYLGLGVLAAAGVDIGLVVWDNAHRPNSDNWDAALAEFLEAYRLRGPLDPEAFPKPEAPDFCLPALDEDRSIRLSDFRGHKPVVLIFGSFG